MNPYIRALTTNVVITLILFFYVSCGSMDNTSISVTGVSVSPTSMIMSIGDSQVLTSTVSPSDADNKSVNWASSNTIVATVSDGIVTAMSEGSATIIVTTVDGGKTAACSVTVKAKTIPVTNVSLNKSELSLVEGDAVTLTATIAPSNATNKNVTWSSSNTSVATVADGKITAVGGGSATITVKTSDGGYTATCSVTVTVPVTSVSLNKTATTIKVGKTETLTATINPTDATNKNVTWSSSDTTIATVENGVVKGVKAGKAKVTVKTEDGAKTAICEVTIENDSVNGGHEGTGEEVW